MEQEEFNEFDILSWWKGRQSQFLVLSIMARDLLSVQSSTIASESAFSFSGRVLSIRRTRLTPASLEMCICLKDHLDAQERIQHTSNLEGDCLEIEEQLLEVEAEAGYAINIADEEINLEKQAMSGFEIDSVSRSSDKSVLFGDPLYLHPNDVTTSLLISIKLTGTENYEIWSCAMKHVIGSKNKLGFLDNTCERPDNTDPFAKQWDMCNSVVLTWILNSISADLFAGQVFSKTAFVVWADLQEAYDKDLQKKEIMEIGNENDGLYLFNVDSALNYKTSLDCPTPICYVSKSLWHQRLGHPADQVLDSLKTKLLFNANPTISPCEVYHKAKQTKEPFPLSDHKSRNVGELVHLDLWGPYKENDGDFGATSVDENTPLEGITESFLDHILKNSDQPAETKTIVPRRSSRPSKVPQNLNEFVIEGKVKYGVERVVNYSNLSKDNFCFASNLNKSIEPKTYQKDVLDSNWINAMNNEMEALNGNHTWIVTGFAAVLAVLKPKRLKADKALKFRSCASRSQTEASQSRQSTDCHKFDSWKNLTSHLPRACLMLALAGFPSSLAYRDFITRTLLDKLQF
nr:putative Gag-polypeptide of LTR copia-type [Tanacetum cinerariifolium]